VFNLSNKFTKKIEIFFYRPRGCDEIEKGLSGDIVLLSMVKNAEKLTLFTDVHSATFT
jgi:hypothetical protein